MINAQDIKIGTAIRMDGKLYFCIDFLHVKPGKGNTFMRTKLKDVVNGYVLERRFNIGEKLEDVRVERRPYQFLYQEGDDYIFMNQETFDQHPISRDQITGVDFLKEGMEMHHCVFANKYYRKEDSLVMSARIGDKRIETIEINLRTLDIVQSRGVCNNVTEYHDRIIGLVKKNIGLIRKKIAS